MYRLRNQRMMWRASSSNNNNKMMKSPLQRFGGSIQLTSPRSVRDLVAFRTPFSRMIFLLVISSSSHHPLWQDPSAAQMQNLWLRRQVLSDGILTIIFENCIFIFGVGLWPPSYLCIYFLWGGPKIIILFSYFLVEDESFQKEQGG